MHADRCGAPDHRALTHRKHRFPAALTLPDFLSGERPRVAGQEFYRCVGTVRSLARDHRASSGEEAADYFLPLAVYTALMLRWCHPNRTECPRKKAVYARQGVFLTLLAGLTLNEGVAITAAEALTSRP